MGVSRFLVFGLCVLPLLASSASASVRTDSATLTASGQVETLRAKCPEGQRATGGGFLGPNTEGSLYGRFFESRKAGQRAWRVKVLQSGDGSIDVTAFVYCDRDAPRTTRKSKTIEIPVATGFASATARCGSSGRAQAGGFSATEEIADNSGADIYGDILQSFRSSRKAWRSSAVTYGTGSAPFTSHVYCADASLPKARSGSETTLSVAGTARSARCRPGTHVAAGGFSQPDADIDAGYYGEPFQLRRAGARWKASALQFGPNPSTLTATAYCVR